MLFSARNVGPKQYVLPSAIALASLYSCPLCVRYAVVSSKYWTGNSVVVPSHADGREDGRVGQDEAAIVEEVADRVDDLVPHAQDGLLARRPDPEVPAVHQVVDAVLLRRDRVVVRLGDHREAGPGQLETALGPRVGAHPAGDDDGGLLGEVVGPGKQLLADVGLRHHDLDEAGPVPDDEEMDLAARAAVVQPAPEGDVLAVELGDVLDVGNGRHQNAIMN